MISDAQRSIWLSSLTFPGRDLVAALLMSAKRGIAVTLIVADRHVREDHEDDVARLESAGVTCRFPDSTHSKTVIIDESSG